MDLDVQHQADREQHRRQILGLGDRTDRADAESKASPVPGSFAAREAVADHVRRLDGKAASDALLVR
jgi:hypothetical protein